MYTISVWSAEIAIDTKRLKATERQCSRFIQVSCLNWDAMDIIGSLARTDRGNRYILTVVDHFTKHVEAYLLENHKAISWARVLLNEFVSRYNVQYIIHTDQWTNFESNLFNEICKLLGIAKTRTRPYHPQCYGQVKRINRTIIDFLSSVKKPYGKLGFRNWAMLMAYRSTVQSSTWLTSYYLVYGKNIRLPFDIIYRLPLTVKSCADYANDVRCTLEQAYETVREKFYLAHERQNDYYDRRSHGSRYLLGGSVWLWNPAPQEKVALIFTSRGQARIESQNACRM